MAVKIIFTFTILVIIIVCDANHSDIGSEKRETGSRSFTKLRADDTRQCRYINKNFDKLNGSWYFVLRTVAPGTPPIHCGRLNVRETTQNGFKFRLRYQTVVEKIDGFAMSGNFINETIMEISELRKLVTGNPEWKFPSHVQMGLCDNDTIFFVEPVYYYGGGMVFTRGIPTSISALKMRFGTFNEDRGKESTVSVGLRCNKKYAIYL